MPQLIEPLSFGINGDEIQYGGGAVRAYFTPKNSDPDYFVMPTRPAQRGGQEFGLITCICDNGCTTCLKTPCVTIPGVPNPPPVGHRRPFGWIALRRDFDYTSLLSPVRVIQNALDETAVFTQVGAWLNSLTKVPVHVYELDLPPTVGAGQRHVVIRVEEVTADVDYGSLFT
ncbi:MAG TPA: hypothetical protein VL463_00255 [Kofleriaceae bacterium]|jgi:hypothetical protein|nr:hypothetical protein [Kofleriaceae bacterium]